MGHQQGGQTTDLTRTAPDGWIAPMRIIAGQFRSRRLHTPEDAATTRPAPDWLRESVFNLLRGHLEGVRIIDAFAGTGSIGLEALSRGASECVFVEKSRHIAQILQSNIDELDVAAQSQVIIGDALAASTIAAAPRPVHLIFFDPPYALIHEPGARQRCLSQLGRFIQLLDDTGYAILRTPKPIAKVEKGMPAPDEDTAELLPIDGALGPETHHYSSMSIHLYMKQSPPKAHGFESVGS